MTPDLYQIGKGQTLTLTVNVGRIGGFSGAIDVAVSGLPKGVTASKLTIPANSNTGIVTLTSSIDAPLDSSAIVVTGEGHIDPSVTIKKIADVVSQLPRPGEGVAVARTVAFAGVTTNASVPLFNLVPETLTVTVKAGSSVSIKLKVDRKPGDAGALPAIVLAAAGQANGLTVEAPQIPEKATETVLKFNAAANATLGPQYLILTGTLAKETQIAPAIHVIVVPK